MPYTKQCFLAPVGVFLSVCFLIGFVENAFSQTGLAYRQYIVDTAKQGVAVDKDYFYVINNTSITKHSRQDGRLLGKWKDETAAIHHLNSGIILNKKLYCCHSNYPELPMASSIEIFDPATMRHTGSHSFGIAFGSATWLDFYRGHWYVAFAHYTGKGGEPGKDNSWSRIVKFTKEWVQVASWVFPKPLLQKFASKSNSGGVFLPDGSILCTGHDEPELYHLELPKAGYTLIWKTSYPVGFQGQGIALEKLSSSEFLLYGIIRGENKVVATKLKIKPRE